MTTAPSIPEATDRDVFITRSFAAPRDLVWRFFTEPALVASWFGPEGVHVDESSVGIVAEVGGRWDLDMVDDATGAVYPFRSTVTSVIPPEYLESTVAAGEGRGEVVLRIWLHDHGDRTRLTLHQGPFEPEALRLTVEGWQLSFEKIDAALAAEGAGA
jgi:uncharacterized protein YndB with AHSA1/START domain